MSEDSNLLFHIWSQDLGESPFCHAKLIVDPGVLGVLLRASCSLICCVFGRVVSHIILLDWAVIYTAGYDPVTEAVHMKLSEI